MAEEVKVVQMDAPAAPPAPQAPAAPQEQLKIPAAIPYDTKTATQIKAFYKFLNKKSDQYRIGDDGSLNVYNKAGQLESSTKMKSYRPITTEERNAMESFRSDRLAGLDIIYEHERRKLIAAYDDYKTTRNITPVLLANRRVNDVELQRVDARSAVRGVKTIPVPKINDVHFDEPYETRKLFGAHNSMGAKDMILEGIFVLERRNFPATLFYGRYEETAEAAAAAAEAVATESGGVEGSASVRLTSGLTARLFFRPEDPQNGILSPLWPVNFIHKETQYACAYQAYEAERMAEQGQAEVRAKILKTRSARTVGIQTVKFTTPAKNPTALWTGILTDMFKQHPELLEKLLATGQDSLVYADPRAGGGGVGIGADNKKILDPGNWKSENIVGKVMESLRATFREQGKVEAAPPPEAKESVITEEEQEAAKKAAIIRNRAR